MTKHIADRPNQTGAGRVVNFTRQEHESGLHPAVVALHSRPAQAATDQSRRTAEFTRIARGKDD